MSQLTNSEFGEAVGCDETTASRLRGGTRIPSLSLYIRIHDAFNLDWHNMAQAYKGGGETFSRLLRQQVFKDE